MIRINNIKLKIGYKNEDIEQAIRKSLRINSFLSYKMAKLSIDSRKKDQIHYVASVDVTCGQEEKILKKVHNNNIMLIKGTDYKIPEYGSMPMQYRPVIIGSGKSIRISTRRSSGRYGYSCGTRLCKWILEKGTSVKSKL